MSQYKSLVLCVNDNPDTLEFLTKGLKREKFDVVIARSSASGLIKARSGIFDIIILDVQLPDGSGIELCKEIRKFDKKTSILFYSPDTRGIEEAMKAGANAFLYRPIPTVVIETIERFNKKPEYA